MSKSKNKKILENELNENLLSLNKNGLISRMKENELAAQKIFYLYLLQKGLKIKSDDIDKMRSDGVVGNTIIECKLDENEAGGDRKAYLELYDIVPKRLKNNGERVPYFRIYIELKTFLVEVYTCEFKLVDSFDWYDEPEKFKKYFDNKKNTYEYDLIDENVDLVEVIQKIYKIYNINKKMDAYKVLEEGIIGWFKPLNISEINIDKLIKNNDMMNEKYVRKEKGAYFTPSRYVKISTEYVLKAVEDSKKDGYDDYVIIDRSAGCCNLESLLPVYMKKHLIMGTIDEAEALIGNIRFSEDDFVKVIDALSEEGVNYYKDKIEEYKIKNNVKNLAVIFYENPPYASAKSNKKGGVNYKKTDNDRNLFDNYVKQFMTEGVDELDNHFLFSAYHFYDTYAYIHYGPVRTWKCDHLIKKEIKSAYLCNRRYFNTDTDSAIALLYLGNKDAECESIFFDSEISSEKFEVKKVYNTISKFYKNEGEEEGVVKIEARNYTFESPRMTGAIGANNKYCKKWVSEKNLLNVVPLFCAARDIQSEKGLLRDGTVDFRYAGTVCKTSDGGDAYKNDERFKQDCLLFTMCCRYNACEEDEKFWEVADRLLDEKSKSNEIYSLYKSLVEETGLKSLKNIKSFKKEELGKLWKYHYLGSKIILLENKLLDLFYNDIRPMLVRYEILK